MSRISYIDNYKYWVQSISWSERQQEWIMYFKPDYIFVAKSFESIYKSMQKAITHEIVSLVSEALGVPQSKIVHISNERDQADARAVVSYILRDKFKITWQEIAEVMKYENHSSALLAAKRSIDIIEIKKKLNKVYSMYNFLK